LALGIGGTFDNQPRLTVCSHLVDRATIAP
jgi:hypothetical protein